VYRQAPRERQSSAAVRPKEETNDLVAVPAGAPYGLGPALGEQRQGGYAVILDAESGEFTQVAGMGRLNHENTVAVPGGGNQFALLTTDDTFSAPSSQLYLYLANHESHIWQDKGSLWAFRVPKQIARGLTGEAPQDALEQWSNENNVFQFIRLEDLAYDKNNPRVVYVADTGASRVVPDPESGRMLRGPGGTVGLADHGRIFRFVFNEKNPRKVDSFSVLADGDGPEAIGFTSPDNMDTSANSLMVQEDTDIAKIWHYDFGSEAWSVVATVNDPDGESSGIVDASKWFGEGAWLLVVQAHGSNVAEEQVGDVLYKREAGQLMLMRILGS
jgi:hypothetical protein